MNSLAVVIDPPGDGSHIGLDLNFADFLGCLD